MIIGVRRFEHPSTKYIMESGKLSTTAAKQVSAFYNTVGWVTNGNVTEDARRFEDLRKYSQSYARKTRRRLLKFIPPSGDYMLDMASGPIQYPEYIEYSQNFQKRCCVDFSSDALRMAKEKIGDHGEFFQGDFLNIPFENDYFDCTISLHTIYHIDKEEQEKAVRKLIRITKPGQPIIIVYSNPNAFWRKKWMRKIYRKRRNPDIGSFIQGAALYFYRFPNSWWKRFEDVATIKIRPWRSFGPHLQTRLIPNNKMGAALLHSLFQLEKLFPRFFAANFEYTMIIMIKK